MSFTLYEFRVAPDEEDDERSQRASGDDTPTADGTAHTGPPKPASPTAPSTIANSSLYTWVAQERFPLFVKVTRGKFGNLLSTRKLVVIAVLEENKIGELTPEMEEFRDMVRAVIDRDDPKDGPYRFDYSFFRIRRTEYDKFISGRASSSAGPARPSWPTRLRWRRCRFRA